jgi:hypothetical protein
MLGGVGVGGGGEVLTSLEPVSFQEGVCSIELAISVSPSRMFLAKLSLSSHRANCVWRVTAGDLKFLRNRDFAVKL